MSRSSGQECPECGDRARTRYTAHDEDGRVVRQRLCPDGHRFSTVEVPVKASFFRMAVDRDNRRRKRASARPSYRPRNPIVVRFRATYGGNVDATYRSDVALPPRDEAVRGLTGLYGSAKVDD